VAGYHSITPNELIERVKATMAARPYKARYSPYAIAPEPAEPAAYALVVGAGFSAGVVPLVRELMQETIGGYYYPKQDSEGFIEISRWRLRKDTARFWRQFNEVAAASGTAAVEVGSDGLPEDPGAAYVTLFTYEGTNVLFALAEQREREARKPTFIERLYIARYGTPSGADERNDSGERFLKSFLRYVMDPGGSRRLRSAECFGAT
jgi:hypothetical protein